MAQAGTITVSRPEPDIAVLTFDDPNKGANVFSQRVLEELEARLDELCQQAELAGVVIRSGKPGAFIAGADINEFVAAGDITNDQVVDMCTRGRKLLQRFSQCPFVTVAAIDGGCFGGGAELSLWCDRRVMSDDRKAQLGFPEVKIGIYPAWGGTARAPRMLGLGNAVELISGGDPIDAGKAAKMGLVSDVVPAAKIEAAAIAVIRAEQQNGEYRRDRQRWNAPLDMDDTELNFLAATASAYIQQQTKGQYPAPLAALNTMVSAARKDIEGACELEAKGMAELFGTPINRSLINVFFLTDRNKKDTGVANPTLKPRKIQSVGVFGAGIMGAGIASVCIRRKLPVTITDAVPAALTGGVRNILKEVSYDKEKRGPDVTKSLEMAPLVNATSADVEFAGCDLVIEAVVENPEVKRELYARIEPLLAPDAILASNTSTIPIARLAEGLQAPERFCGIHFFNPVRRMPLVEVIRGPKTSDETVVTAVAYAKSIGKSPIVVNDGPGFLVNRLLLPYMNEALELLLDGADIKQLDRAARNFGMPMGPIALYDVIGMDTALLAGGVMQQAFPDRCTASALLPAMVHAGRLGQKSGVGFFLYKDNKGRGAPDPTLGDILNPLVRKHETFGEEQLISRLFLPMVLEATRILEEKVVRDPRDVDLGLIFGTGFPPFRGGLLFWADTLGARQIIEMLAPLEHFGERTRPTAMLKKMAEEGRGFYN